ncbi:MAG TPA: DNA polymerase Y family protein [Tepidisphaeraceae bacterium]|nr:DNA polymerase Y family protein [Tepidisphaeraceae bacterium]
MRHVAGGQALHLCAYLRHWPIDRLRRRRPELRRKPLVLVETIGTRQIVVHVSPEMPAGIYPGMALAAAKARHAALLDLPATPTADLRSLEALGYWLMRFSPGVSVYPASSLFLDATGLERLYGGLANFRRRVAQALASLRVTAAVTIAPTPGAAWALAAFGRNGSHVVTNEQMLPALSPLPPEALRLDGETVSVLSALGVRTIGSLLQLPRNEFAVRFGPGILTRIDQATGAVHEPLTHLVHRSPIRATLEFEGVVESLDAIQFAVQELTRQVAGQLAARGLGARALRLTFRQPYASPVERMVRLVRPCRNESALVKLICCAMENLEAGEGFVAASLAVSAAERLGDEQPALIGGEEERDAAELDHLVERLRARLDHGMVWGELVESNLPELASRSRDSAGTVAAAPVTAHLFRPLRLLRQPRSIKAIVRPSESRDGEPVSFTDCGEVRRLDHVRGPERITGQWWNGRWKTRDYFDVLDAAGGRYWIFRVAQTGLWFLHGMFE